MEQEVVFLHMAKTGRVTVDFFSIECVEKTDATGVYNALNAAMERVGFEKDDWTKKLVGFGSCCGRAVMNGVKGEVIAKLKTDQPLVPGVHCIVLSWHSKTCMGKQPVYSKLDSLLSGLYMFRLNSSLNRTYRSMLKRTFDALGIRCSHIMPTCVCGIHTLLTVVNLWEAYPAIVMHLQQVYTCTILY